VEGALCELHLNGSTKFVKKDVVTTAIERCTILPSDANLSSVKMRCDLAAGHTLKDEGIATLGGPP
jgi:hypothetical protein